MIIYHMKHNRHHRSDDKFLLLIVSDSPKVFESFESQSQRAGIHVQTQAPPTLTANE